MRLELKQAAVQEAMAALEAIRMIDAPALNLKEGVDSLVEAHFSARSIRSERSR